MTIRSGALRVYDGDAEASALNTLLWFLEQPEVANIAKREGSIGLGIQALKTSLGEHGAQPKPPDRFDSNTLAQIVREKMTKEFRENLLPSAEEHIKRVITKALGEKPVNVSEEHEVLIKQKLELEKEQAKLKLDQKAFEEEKKNLEREIAEFREANDLCIAEANRYDESCKKIDQVLSTLGGLDVLKNLAENVFKLKLAKEDERVLSKAAKDLPGEFSDGLTFQEMNGIVSALKRKDTRTCEDFMKELQTRKRLKKKLDKGITASNGLSWQQLTHIVSQSAHLDDISRRIVSIRHEVGS